MLDNLQQLTTATPVCPAAPYIGGKRILAPEVIKRINAIAHNTYAEPFVGMGGVFFRRNRVPKAEVINDLNGDVANFFRILQRHYVHFMEMLRFQLTSRQEFERLIATNPETLTDLERAARFLYLQKAAFGGKVTGRAFGVDVASGARFNVTKLSPVLEDIHDRLAGVVIECLPFQKFFERYDRRLTLFYIDPPYWGAENYYGNELFARDDFEALAELLSGLKGQFILSLNDTPGVRNVFAQFNITETSVVYTVRGTRPKRAGELIISGR